MIGLKDKNEGFSSVYKILTNQKVYKIYNQVAFSKYFRDSLSKFKRLYDADPAVQADLEHWLAKWVVDGDPVFTHRAEGPDDMAAHIRSALTQTSISVPYANHQLMLGTWQGIYLWEHRYAPHARELAIHVAE